MGDNALNAWQNHLTAWLAEERALVSHPTALLVLAVLLVLGYLFGRLAVKLRLPAVTGQILAGVVVGPYVLHVFNEESFRGFAQITNFALGFVGFAIGSHLDLARLRSAGRRILTITVCDIVVTSALVLAAMHWLVGVPLEASLLVAAVVAGTDPGTLLHVVKEKRAKGILTKTILASVALNNVLALLLFYTVYYWLICRASAEGFTWLGTIGRPFWLLAESLLTGGAVGAAVIVFTEKRRTSLSFLTIVFIAILLTVGTSETLHYSGTLSCLILGVIIANFSKEHHRLFAAFQDLEREVFCLLFVLAGTHLDLGAIGGVGMAGAALIGARFLGKTAGPALGAKMGGTVKTIRRLSGISMYTLGGVAIGLVLLCDSSPVLAPWADGVTAVVLTAVVFFELAAPFATGLALKYAGEEGKDRVRLLDFLQEEYILTGLVARDKWEALDIMAAFLHRTHRCHDISLPELKKRVAEREREVSTGVGENIAIPHAIVDSGPKIRGVIGISNAGIDFGSIDGKPVHIVVMIATPKENYDMHLQVLAHISRIFGSHPQIKRNLIACTSAERVFEILQVDEVEQLNPFFES